MSGRKFVKVGLLVVALIPAVAAVVAPALAKQRRHKHDQAMTSSCANHSGLLRMSILGFTASGEQKKRYPSGTDARSAFGAMDGSDELNSKWLSSAGAACPEAFSRDGSMGYIYVGDGLPVKTAFEQSALLLFCPADSHQGSDQHCHVLIGNGERICLKSNAEMINLLSQEIRRADEGVVPYTTNALSRIGLELKTRQRYETQRHN